MSYLPKYLKYKARYLGQIAGSPRHLAKQMAQATRETLPKRIILVRHGESEGNRDPRVYADTPDHCIPLTKRGVQQAKAIGALITNGLGETQAAKVWGGDSPRDWKPLIHDSARPLKVVVSPYQRTMQTANHICQGLEAAGYSYSRTQDPLIREQEYGNFQRDDAARCIAEQRRVGEFFYRWPTGESGADVYLRVQQWWQGVLSHINLLESDSEYDNKYETVIIVAHAITIRILMMHIMGWSPHIFQVVLDVRNCGHYVLDRDLQKDGWAPYVLNQDLSVPLQYNVKAVEALKSRISSQ